LRGVGPSLEKKDKRRCPHRNSRLNRALRCRLPRLCLLDEKRRAMC